MPAARMHDKPERFVEGKERVVLKNDPEIPGKEIGLYKGFNQDFRR